jgi:predicted transposase YbfD/YdcC
MLLIEQLKQIPDHRHAKGKKYSLWVILFMSLMGSLCGYIGYRPLADFASLHQEQLEELLELPPAPSTPSYSTFRRILLAVEPQHLATVFNVKQNQPTLDRTIELTAQTQTAISHTSVIDSSHGRVVKHWAGDPTSSSVSVFDAPAELLTKWIGLKSAIVVHRNGTRAQTPFSETIYYLSTQISPADTYMTLIRGHWAIENRLHWVKDVTFDEDYPPRLGGPAPVNWAIFFTWIVTLVRRAGIRTVPQALRLWANQLERVFSFLV